MAKAPRAGLVKTRLHPLLGPQGCAHLQTGLIRRTVLVAQLVAPTRTYLALDSVDSPGELVGVVPAGVTVLPQSGPDLGSRMSIAAADVFRDHRGPLLLIGTDAPTLTASHLRRAAELWPRSSPKGICPRTSSPCSGPGRSAMSVASQRVQWLGRTSTATEPCPTVSPRTSTTPTDLHRTNTQEVRSTR